MKENYCILSIKKIKTMGGLQVAHEHNFREINLRHVDATLSAQNEELIDESGCDYRDLWYRRIKEVEIETGKPVATKKDSVLAYEVLTSFSRDADVDMEAWKKANVQWMYDTFGKDNILSMQLHMDETTPHIHTIVVPIDERGHLCAKSFTGGRAKMFKLQTSYGKAMSPLGLSRGEMYSKSKKEDLSRFYKALNKAASETAPEIEPGEKVDSYVARVNAYIQDLSMASLWKEKEAQRAIELEQTKFTQFHAKYSDAIKLQDTLEASFGGNRAMVKQRLQKYKKVEESVPRKILNSFIDNLLLKFPSEQNIRARKERKKKNNNEQDIRIDG